MRSAVLRACAALLFLLISTFVTESQQDSSQKPSNDTVWLAVEEQPRGQLRIEPVATIAGNSLSPVQTSCLPEAQTSDDFAAPYLQPGTKYSLFLGGSGVGEGTVVHQDATTHTARLDYTGPAKIRGPLRALATNAPSHEFRVGTREAATAEQRASALALARELFAQHGVPEKLLSKIRAEYVTRTYLAPSPQPGLIGSFSLDEDDSAGLVHGLFFIAGQPVEKLEPEFVWIHLSETGTDEEFLRLVDHADLFGTGDDEVIGKLISVETQSHRYLVFRRTPNQAHWELIFKTEPLGCSY